jgi:acyl-CoA thioester hydrolase
VSGLFRYLLRVRYAECDAQKVVFNSRYSDFMDLAGTEFIKAIGFGQALLKGELDYQVVKQTIEWKGSARFDDVVEISVGTERVGNTSFILTGVFRIAGREDPIVNAETVYVYVDPQTLKKAPVPDDLRAALEHGAKGVVVDHAAYVAGHR